MKRLIIAVIFIIVAALIVLPNLHTREQYVWGRIRIPARGIYAEVYTTAHGPDCGCCGTLWNGGKVTVKADLSSVQLYDMAELTSLDGERLMMECVSITGVPSWLQQTDGDVLVVNGRWVYRFIRL